MQILSIVHRTDKDTVLMDKSYITLIDLFASIQPNSKIIFNMLNDNDVEKSIDASALYRDYEFSLIDTWTKVEAFLTDVLLETYKTSVVVPQKMLTKTNGKTFKVLAPASSNTSTQPKIFSCENNTGIEISYGSHVVPVTRNIKNLKWNLPDIIFTHTNPLFKRVDFNNCLPIVNGCICYPKVYNEELFAYEGSKVLRNMNSVSKGIMLLDFSPIANMSVIRLSSCNKIDTAINSHLRFTLPEGDYLNKTIMLVIAGRLFKQNELNLNVVGNTTTVDIELDKKLMECILASNFFKFNQKIFNTSNMMIDINHYLDHVYDDRNNMTFQEEILAVKHKFADTNIPFVIVLDNPNINYRTFDPLLTIKPDKLKFEDNVGGLLVNKSTRDIIDYTRIEYTTTTLVTINPITILNMTDRTNKDTLDTEAIAYTRDNYASIDRWNPFNLYNNLNDPNNYMLLDFYKL